MTGEKREGIPARPRRIQEWVGVAYTPAADGSWPPLRHFRSRWVTVWRANALIQALLVRRIGRVIALLKLAVMLDRFHSFVDEIHRPFSVLARELALRLLPNFFLFGQQLLAFGVLDRGLSQKLIDVSFFHLQRL
jgi:hypothetical protein